MTRCCEGGGAEERQHFLLELSDALRTLEDPLQIQAESCRRLGLHLGVNRVNYAEVEREAFVAMPGFVDGVAPLPLDAHAVSDFGEALFAACRRGEDLVIDDVATSTLLTPTERQNYERVEISAFVAVPLTKATRWVGVFSAQSASPRRWAPSAVQLIREVAERIWAAIARARAEQALRESELRYRTLFESMDQGFAVKELVRDERGIAVELRYVEVNRRFEQLIGCSRAAMVGGLRGQTLGVDREWLRICQRVVDSGELIRVEHHFPSLGRWFEIALFPYGRDRLAALYVDVTANKLAEERLRASEARQAFLLLLSDHLRVLADPREIMRVAAEMLGQHLEVATVQYTLLDQDGEGAQMAGVYNDGRLPAALEGFRFALSAYGDWATALRSGQEVFTSDNHRDWCGLVAEKTPRTGVRAGAAIPLLEDGSLIAVLSAAHPEPRAWSEDEKQLLRDAATRTYSAVLRARSEAALRESEAAATCANHAKDEFLATLGHELRTPLSAILLWAGALKSGAVPPTELKRAVQAILASAQSQSRLIEDLLDLSRLGSGKLVLAPDSVVVEGVARAALQLVQASAQAKGVTVELVVRDCPGAAVLDAARLQQVLLNLLSNAIKFTPQGGTATLRLRKRHGFVEVEVQDNGQGIARDFMPHIFERFRQADIGHNRAHSGLGIGLALSRQLVELQGGTIAAHSAGEGMGATFRVRLPWIDGEVGPAEPSSSATSDAAFAETRLQGITVLLVEDDACTGDAMQWTLARAGATVARATSAPEAVELLEAGQRGSEGAAMPDVIFSDLGLPGMSGYELMQGIVQRQRDRGQPPIPACAVSAHARDVDKLRAIEAGFDMYLVKPITPERLIGAVEDLKAVAAAPVRACDEPDVCL